MADYKPTFSAGLVIGIVFVFWLSVFGGAIMYGATEFQPAAATTPSK